MDATTRRTLSVLAAALLAGTTAACSSAGSQAAQEVFDECHNEDMTPQVLRVDGDTVFIELTGEAARAYAGVEDEIDALAEEESFDGVTALLAMVTTSQCVAEATGYPGSYDQLTDGEEWDGWRYAEEDGAGSEMKVGFTSTS